MSSITGSNNVFTKSTLCVGLPIYGAAFDLKLGALDGVKVINESVDVSLYLYV